MLWVSCYYLGHLKATAQCHVKLNVIMQTGLEVELNFPPYVSAQNIILGEGHQEVIYASSEMATCCNVMPGLADHIDTNLVVRSNSTSQGLRTMEYSEPSQPYSTHMDQVSYSKFTVHPNIEGKGVALSLVWYRLSYLLNVL